MSTFGQHASILQYKVRLSHLWGTHHHDSITPVKARCLTWFVFHTNFALHKNLFIHDFVTPLDQVQSKPRFFFLNQNYTWNNSRIYAKIIRKRNFFLSLCISFFGNEVSGNGRDWSQPLCMRGTSGTHWLRKQWKLWKKRSIAKETETYIQFYLEILFLGWLI